MDILNESGKGQGALLAVKNIETWVLLASNSTLIVSGIDSNYWPLALANTPSAAWCQRCVNRLATVPAYVYILGPSADHHNFCCAYCAASQVFCKMVGGFLRLLARLMFSSAGGFTPRGRCLLSDHRPSCTAWSTWFTGPRCQSIPWCTERTLSRD